MTISRLCTAALVVLVSIGTTSARDEPRVKSGTGFYVSVDGYVVTTTHVLDGCRPESVFIWGHDHLRRAARIVDEYEYWDIALLKADVRVATVAPAPVRFPSGKVYVLGYGVDTTRPLDPQTVEGTYQGKGRYVDDLGAPFFLRIRARLRPGDSGGAVIGEGGGLIGMVKGRYSDQPDIGVILPSQIIAAFLSRNDLRLPARTDAPALRPWAILDAISVLVQCSPRRGESE